MMVGVAEAWAVSASMIRLWKPSPLDPNKNKQSLSSGSWLLDYAMQFFIDGRIDITFADSIIHAIGPEAQMSDIYMPSD